jgi:Na+/proline symporter
VSQFLQIHTAIILITILIFWFKVYASGNQVGSPGKMWDLLIEAAKRNNYSAPTKDGSYLTIRSLGALKFAILSILEYTGVVFLDNSFHQKGIAADPASAIPGYVLGGLAWYAMPFTLATTMGILAVALENTPAFPTYPRRMNTQEIGAGLALPYAAQTIDGKGGAGAGESIQSASVLLEWSLLTMCSMCSPRVNVHELHQCYLQCDDRHLNRSLL